MKLPTLGRIVHAQVDGMWRAAVVIEVYGSCVWARVFLPKEETCEVQLNEKRDPVPWRWAQCPQCFAPGGECEHQRTGSPTEGGDRG